MRLESLGLEHFRNLTDATLAFPPGLTVIHGQNAQGKTNLLEAVYAVITGSSHRAQRDQDMIARSQERARVEARFVRPSGELELALQLLRAGRKVRTRNGKAYRPGQDPLGDVRVVLFSPEDLGIAQGPPALRRRFVDVELGQSNPVYARLVRDYQRATSQRNGALRTGRTDLLDALNAVWAPLAARLTLERRRLIQALEPFARQAHRHIAPGDGPLTLAYTPSLGERGSGEVLALLPSVAAEETARRATVLGPHRDDIRLWIGDNELRAYGSQGQQRAAAVALKVGATSFLEARDGQTPLLLLDDVLSELDQTRREALAEVVGRGQTLLTTADDGTLPGDLRPAAVLSVTEGKVG